MSRSLVLTVEKKFFMMADQTVALYSLATVACFYIQDEYFEVDKSKTKHDGYFVNRGTLEKM